MMLFKYVACLTTLTLCNLMAPMAQGGEISLEQKFVWSHMVGWNSWSIANISYQGHHDVPMARPTGRLMVDYRQEVKGILNAGIDGVAFDIIAGNGYGYSCLKLLEAAKGSRLQIANTLCVFDKDPLILAKKIAGAYQSFKDFPNYARIHGKPVFFTFWAKRRPPAYWHTVRKELKDAHQLEIFLAGDPDPLWNKPTTIKDLNKYAGIFDIFYNYAEYGRGGHQPVRKTFRITAQAAKTGTRTGKWAASVAPGYLGSWPLRGRNNFYIPFKGVDVFWNNWQATVESDASWVHLADWNDLDETPLQPMIFQFHTYGELNRYWAGRWRGEEVKTDSPRIYLAYQREQMLGALQRIEVVSLPMTGNQPVQVRGQLLDMQGKVLSTLSTKTFKAGVAGRDQWLVDTSVFTSTPMVEPLITIRVGDQITQRRLPIMRLRTGWLDNHVVLKVPTHEIAPGRAKLQLTDTGNGMIRAVVEIDTPSRVRTAMLWCDDRPIGSLDMRKDVLPTYGLQFQWRKNYRIKIKVVDGAFVRSFQHGPNTPRMVCDATSMKGIVGRSDYFAANVAGTSDTTLCIVVNKGKPQKIKLEQLRHEDVPLLDAKSNEVAVLKLADHNPIAALPRRVKVSKGKLYGQFPMAYPSAAKLFYVRLETEDGRIFYSNCLTPYAKGLPLVTTTILQTAMTLDKGFTPPSSRLKDNPLNVHVHPALIQQSRWDLAYPGNRLPDTLGNDTLYLGSNGTKRYKPVSGRIPSKVTLPDGTPALSFDGVDDIAELAIHQQPYGAFTLMLKIRVEKFAGKPQTIFGAQSEANNPLLKLDAKGHLIAGRLASQARYSILARSPKPLPIGQWCKVVVTFNETQTTLYLDSQRIAQAKGSANRAYGNIRMYLGGLKHPFFGQIADLMLTSCSTFPGP